MAGASALYGVIDIGSNSVRMVIFDTAHSPPAQLFNEKVFCALGRDLDKTGKLNPEGKSAALAGLIEYAAAAKAHKLNHFDIVGTASLRDATDGAEFMQAVADQAGLKIKVITGLQEARYAALGVLSLAPDARGIVADFGGGSLEFARLTGGAIEETVSRPYGAFRAMGMGDQASRIIREGLQELVSVFGDAPALHTIGGSWRALGQAYLDETGETRETLQGYEIGRAEMSDFCKKVTHTSPEILQARFKFEDKRAALAPISAFVLAQVLDNLRPEKMVVSLAGIRDGIVYDFLHPSGLSNA